MPELPEVEITRRHLESAMRDRVLESVVVSHDRTIRHNHSRNEVVARLTGRRVLSVERLGKFLHMALDDGQTLVAHLGMSGRWAVDGDDDVGHTHFTARLDDGTTVTFIDPRTFGFVAVYDEEDLAGSGLGRLGKDAWKDLPAPETMLELLKRRSAPMKAVLLDQSVLAGLGNIYADEVLFRSKVHPLVPANQVTAVQSASLMEATSAVLASALENGGTSLGDRSYLLPDGRAGENMMALQVYGRDGEPCYVCGSTIEKVVVRARSTHFCAQCQAMS